MEDFMGELSACIHWRNEKRIKLSLGELSSMQYRRKRGLQRRGGRAENVSIFKCSKIRYQAQSPG